MISCATSTSCATAPSAPLDRGSFPAVAWRTTRQRSSSAGATIAGRKASPAGRSSERPLAGKLGASAMVSLVLQPNIRYAFKVYWDFFDHNLPLSHASMLEALALRLRDRDRAPPGS